MNIAEILKYCPKGTKLYSLVDGEVTLENIVDSKYAQYPIEVNINKYKNSYYTKDGLLSLNRVGGECVLFPSKDQRDWSTFRIPVKKGDIMMQIDGTLPFIASGGSTIDDYPKYICGITDCGNFKISNNNYGWTDEFYIPASEEAKKKLFDKMEEAGYRWNANTLELERKPTYRPFKDKEECYNEMLKHKPFGWLKSKSLLYNIISINTNGIIIHNNISSGGFNFKSAFSLTFVDGTPFGIKE